MKRILLFKLKTICYNSTSYFMDCLKDALVAQGAQVEVFDATTTPLDRLNDYVGQSYDAIIDFNSKLPGVEMDEGGLFLDQIDAPFYNYLLDHPLYLHESLHIPLKNGHVICLDENHADYVRRCYPHIKSVTVLPLPGMKAESLIPFEGRHKQVLFSGTYTDPDDVYKLIQTCGGEPEKEMLELADILFANPSLSFEDAYDIFLSNHDITLSDKSFSVRLHAYFLTDLLVTSTFRKRIITTLAKEDVPLTLMGHGWRKAGVRDYSNVRILSPVPFAQSFDHMANSKIVLNIMPWFKAGVHDRVFSAMRNGAVCCSDVSDYLTTHFTDEQSILLYDLNDLNTLPDKIKDLLSQPQRLAAIAKEGQIIADENHTWEQRAATLLTMF